MREKKEKQVYGSGALNKEIHSSVSHPDLLSDKLTFLHKNKGTVSRLLRAVNSKLMQRLTSSSTIEHWIGKEEVGKYWRKTLRSHNKFIDGNGSLL